MGLVEVLGRLRELLARRKKLIQTLIDEKPDVFIGIDAPDFTLNIELKLRQAGIKTVALRQPVGLGLAAEAGAQDSRRLRPDADAAAVRSPVLRREGRAGAVCRAHPGRYHSLEADRDAARQALGLPEGPLVALMPGSRGGEVSRLGGLFFDAAERLRALRPGVRFVLPCASAQRRVQLEALLVGRDLPVTLLDGRSHEALAACDAVLIASGTATLEALLYKRPMVVAYRLAPLTFWILKRMVKSPYVSLPNLLAQRLLVPELLQDDATAEALATTLSPLIDGGEEQTRGFDEIHRTLRRDASNQAADAVLTLIGAKP